MPVLVIIFIILVIGCIIRYMVEGTCSANSCSQEVPKPVSKPLAEMSLDKLQSELSQVEIDLEMQKIKYQSSLTNPYVLGVTRDLVKNNLEHLIRRKQDIMTEINKKNNSNPNQTPSA